jgi:hypothetical protein
MIARPAFVDGDQSKMNERTTSITFQDAQDREDLMRIHPRDFGVKSTDYYFYFPQLICADCVPFGDHALKIEVGDSKFNNLIQLGNHYVDHRLMVSFAIILAHYFISVKGKKERKKESHDFPFLMPIIYPKHKLISQDLLIVPRSNKHIMSLFHSSDHYAVVEIVIKLKTITIFDGLQWVLTHWTDHFSYLLTKCMLVVWEGSTSVEYVTDSVQPNQL